MKKTELAPMIAIGASKETLAGVYDLYKLILNSDVDQTTKVEAIRSASQVLRVENTSIMNCTFTNRDS